MASDTKTPNQDQPGFRRDSASQDDKARPENQQSKLNERLDEALEETFPTSDPVSVKITK